MTEDQFKKLLAEQSAQISKDMDQRFADQDARFNGFAADQDARFNGFANELKERFDHIEDRFNQIDNRFNRLETKVDSKADAGAVYDKLNDMIELIRTDQRERARHRDWIKQLAKNTHTKLVPEPKRQHGTNQPRRRPERTYLPTPIVTAVKMDDGQLHL